MFELTLKREHLEGLLGILLGPLVEAFDFERVEQVNRSFISDELRTQESDMVFSLPFRTPTQTCEQVIVYLLIEHQSTVDRSMELRLLSYMVQIWMEERRQWTEAKQPEGEWRLTPIVPIVFYTGSGEWKAPLSLTALYGHPRSPHPLRPNLRHLAPRCQSHRPKPTHTDRTPFRLGIDRLATRTHRRPGRNAKNTP